MNLPISKDYRIKTDEHNWIIQKLSGTRKNRQTGIVEPNYKDIGYYPSLESAVNGLSQRMLRLCPAQTLLEALEANRHHIALITTALAPNLKITQVTTVGDAPYIAANDEKGDTDGAHRNA